MVCRPLEEMDVNELRDSEKQLAYHAERAPKEWYSERALAGFREDLAKIRDILAARIDCPGDGEDD